MAHKLPTPTSLLLTRALPVVPPPHARTVLQVIPTVGVSGEDADKARAGIVRHFSNMIDSTASKARFLGRMLTPAPPPPPQPTPTVHLPADTTKVPPPSNWATPAQGPGSILGQEAQPAVCLDGGEVDDEDDGDCVMLDCSPVPVDLTNGDVAASMQGGGSLGDLKSAPPSLQDQATVAGGRPKRQRVVPVVKEIDVGRQAVGSSCQPGDVEVLQLVEQVLGSGLLEMELPMLPQALAGQQATAELQTTTEQQMITEQQEAAAEQQRAQQQAAAGVKHEQAMCDAGKQEVELLSPPQTAAERQKEREVCAAEQQLAAVLQGVTAVDIRRLLALTRGEG